MDEIKRAEMAMNAAYITLANRLAKTLGLDLVGLANDLEQQAAAIPDAGVQSRLEVLALGLDALRQQQEDARQRRAPRTE